MKKLLVLIIIASAFIFPSVVKANVLINEISANDSTDWVELYATENTDISNWILHDSAASKIGQVPPDTTIGPTSTSGSFLVVNVGTRLNTDKDQIKLYKDDDSTKIDEIDYGDMGQVCTPMAGQSVGRYPDGSNLIDRLSSQSPNAPNSWNTVHACPTPMSSPTATPTPTPSPTQSPTVTPTSTPTKSPTPKPTPTPTPMGIRDNSATPQADVLGLRDSLTATDAPTQKPIATTGGNSFPIVAGVFIVSGIALMGFAIYWGVRKQKENSSATISE